MKYLIMLALAAAVLGGTMFIDPNTSAGRIFNVPLGTKYGLVLHTDSLHVTTDEKGWALGDCVGFTLINPNANYLLWRTSNALGADTLQCYVGDYGALDMYPPGSLKSGYAVDSLFIDGESACTVWIYYWVAQ
jgi:hypothetical protein